MSIDVFEWDDATESIVKKAVENRDLDNATDNLKTQADETLNNNFNQFNFEQVMRDRDTVIKSIQQTLSPRLKSFENNHDQIMNRVDNDGFQVNYEDNAVDRDDWDMLMSNYRDLREISSQLAIWAYVAHANSRDVGKAVDISQMQADQNKAMQLLNENYDKFISAADKIGRQVRDGMKEGVSEALDERESRIEELERENERLQSELDDRPDGVELDDPEPLAKRESELADLVSSNPSKDIEFFMEEMDLPKKTIRKLESQIQNKGFNFSID